MKLWYLRQKGACCDHEGEVLAAIVRANTEQEARLCGGNFYCDEGREVWLDPEQSLCIELDPNGPYGDVYVDMECI
jgi:hypothetical protein